MYTGPLLHVGSYLELIPLCLDPHGVLVGSHKHEGFSAELGLGLFAYEIVTARTRSAPPFILHELNKGPVRERKSLSGSQMYNLLYALAYTLATTVVGPPFQA